VSDDPLWYKDAVFYELHVKAFQDSNSDGIGDFNGLIQRLDYVQALVVDVIWLSLTTRLPHRPSTLLRTHSPIERAFHRYFRINSHPRTM